MADFQESVNALPDST